MAMTKKEQIIWEALSVQERQSVIGRLIAQANEHFFAGRLGEVRFFEQLLVDRSHVPSMVGFANMLQKGLGGSVDLVGARKWYLEAAQKGHTLAMNNYAVLLYQGLGGPVDLVGTREWYLKAAMRGEAYAQLNLYVLYRQNQGGDVDFSQVRDWVKGIKISDLKKYAHDSLGVPKRLVLELLEERKESGAMVELVDMLLHGNDEVKDIAKAKEVMSRWSIKHVGDEHKEAYGALWREINITSTEGVKGESKKREANGELSAKKRARF